MLRTYFLFAGYEHPVEQVVSDLLQSIEDPALALLQWEENFSVAQVHLSQLIPA